MQNTRVKLLRTAARLFAQKGYVATSIRDIVKATGENVSSVSYHFGNKRNLYVETLKYLLTQNRSYIFGGDKPLPTPEDIDKLSVEQTWQALHNIIDKVLEIKFSRMNIPVERIFTYAELEGATDILTSLQSYLQPMQNLVRHTLAKLTGIKENCDEMQLLGQLIFLQINLSERDRLMILHTLGENQNINTPPEKFKKIVWRSIETILKSYDKEQNKNEKIFINRSAV